MAAGDFNPLISCFLTWLLLAISLYLFRLAILIWIPVFTWEFAVFRFLLCNPQRGNRVISSTFYSWHRGSVSPPRCLPFPSCQTDAADMKALRRLLNRWGRANVCGHVSTSERLFYDPLHPVFNMACVCCSQLEWKYFAPMHLEKKNRAPKQLKALDFGCKKLALGGATVRLRLEFDISTVKKSVCPELHRRPGVVMRKTVRHPCVRSFFRHTLLIYKLT